MIVRRFFTVVAVILLGSALFCGNFSPFALAEVVHAYRKPDEADMQWLLGNVVQPNSADIVQMGFLSTSNNMLVSCSDPCSPVNVPIPIPSIPPAPQTQAVNNKMNTGLVPEIDGVVNSVPTNTDPATAIVQMSGERLPPPPAVPTEQSLVVPTADFTAAPLPPSSNKGFFGETSRRSIAGCNADDWNAGCGDFDDDAPCVCFTCITCGDHRKDKPRYVVPDMFGSSAWLTGYSVGASGTPATQFTLPTMLLTRPNVVEHFNAEVQNRIWADYRHWNNAVSFGNENRAVEQFSFGLEKQILRRSSLELRVPVISQFGSGQAADTTVELGNISVFMKQVLCRKTRLTISGGVGVTMPTAEDWLSPIATTRLKNNAYYLVSFLGVQWHPNNKTFGHFVVQTDLALEKNELVSGTSRAAVDGQQVIRTGIQLGRWIYRTDHGKRPCRLGAFAEVNYVVVTDGSAQQTLGTVYVSAFDARQSTLTAAVGMPMVFGKLTCANSLILPISGSNRPFSVGYSFSLTRQF